MSFIDNVQRFIRTYWQIILTLIIVIIILIIISIIAWQTALDNWFMIVFSIVITVGGGIISTVLMYKYSSSAEQERLIMAKNSILDILESMIINKQFISKKKIIRLLRAIDREYSVELSNVSNPISLIEDIELRFEKSHHLDSTQKEKYCAKLEKVLENIENEDISTSYAYSELLGELINNIKSDDQNKSLKIVNILKNKIIEEPPYAYAMKSSISSYNKRNFMLFFTIWAAIYWLVTFYYYLNHFVFDVSYYLIFALLIVMATSFFAYYAYKIIVSKRSYNYNFKSFKY